MFKYTVHAFIALFLLALPGCSGGGSPASAPDLPSAEAPREASAVVDTRNGDDAHSTYSAIKNNADDMLGAPYDDTDITFVTGHHASIITHVSKGEFTFWIGASAVDTITIDWASGYVPPESALSMMVTDGPGTNGGPGVLTRIDESTFELAGMQDYALSGQLNVILNLAPFDGAGRLETISAEN